MATMRITNLLIHNFELRIIYYWATLTQPTLPTYILYTTLRAIHIAVIRQQDSCSRETHYYWTNVLRP